MTAFIIIAKAIVFLMALVLLLSIRVVLFNSLAIRREALAQKGRSALREALEGYLKGEIHVSAFSTPLHGEEKLLTGLVAQLAEELGEQARKKLLYIFETSGTHFLVQQEIRRLSHSWNRFKRQRAATYLPYIANRQAIIPPLLHALEDKVFMVRFSAALSLAKIKAIEAVIPILEHLSAPALWPAERTVEIIHEIGGDAVPTLLHYLAQPVAKDGCKGFAISALGLLRARQAIPLILIHLSDNPDKEIRIQSAKALGNIGGPEAVAPLCASMHDSEWEVRALSATSLGLLKADRAVSALAGALGDPFWWVRYNSADALAELGQKGVAALENALTHEDRFAAEVSRLVLQERSLMKSSTVTLKP